MILMKSEVVTVTKIKHKTGAKFFKDLKIGDELQFSVPLEYAGTSRGKSYPSDVTVVNINTKDEITWTFNQMYNRLEAFELSIK